MFTSAEDMLNEIAVNDLYNPKTGDYVFLYNETGSIAVYNLSNETAEEIARSAGEECWSAFLGPGGTIYGDTSNYEWCKKHYMEEDWMECGQFLEQCMEKEESAER